MSDLEGTRPEDVYIPPMTPQELQAVADQIVAHADTGEMLVELHDSEIIAAVQIQLYLTAKYAYRPGTHANLMSLKGEAEHLFERIGLTVLVDWVGPSLRVPPQPPEIVIQGRSEPFDADRQRYDVRRGVADQFWRG